MSKKLTNLHKNTLISQLTEARSFKERTVGLIGRTSLSADEALWIHRCNSIHTFFMKFAIDCVFLDKSLRVKAVHSNVSPWKLVLPVWGAQSVIEMTSGRAADLDIKVGDQLYVGA